MSERYVTLVAEGEAALKRGDPAEARARFEAAIRLRRAFAPLRRAHGRACLAAGDAAAAYAAFRQAAFLEPGDARTLGRLARLARTAGDRAAAADWGRRYWAARGGRGDPIGAAAGGGPAGLIGRLGRSRAAGAALDEELPPPPRALRRQVRAAEAARRARETKRAYALLAGAVEAAPGDPGLRARLGRLKLALADGFGALEDLQRARADLPDNGCVAGLLVQALVETGDLDAAQARLAALTPAQRAAWDVRLAELAVTSAAGDLDAAVAQAEALLHAAPDSLEALRLLIANLAAKGAFDAAAAAIERASAMAPLRGDLFLTASTIRCLAPEGPLFARAERLVATPAASQHDRAAAHFALGRTLAEAGAVESGFAHLAKANALVDVIYDPEEVDRFVARSLAAFTPALFAAPAEPARGAGLILVVGLPRSGSTLVERILASHPRAAGVGESPAIYAAIRDLILRPDYPEGVAALTETELAARARRYLEAVGRAAGGAPVVVDKELLKFRFLGLVARLLPGARIVHCRRGPMDLGYSIFQQQFRGQHPYAYALESIAHFHQAHDRLMAHWHSLLPGRIHELRYEDLVADQEGETRRLLAAVGLPFDPACLDFHRSAGAVRTASLYQVRQKMNAGSVAAWRRHARELAPLSAALRRYGVAC